MKNWFLFLIMMMCASLPSLADSPSKTERGGSCTDRCTMGGKEAYEVMEKREFGFYFNATKYDYLCLEKHADQPGSVNWCERNCRGEGGMWTKWMNSDRKAKVEEFIKASKESCYKYKKEYDDYQDMARKMLEKARERVRELKKH